MIQAIKNTTLTDL